MQIYTRQRRRMEVPIVPLIDILAILLIFFIVTTTFKEKKSRLQIDLPSTTSLVSSEDTASRTAIGIDPEGGIFFDDEPMDLAGLESRLQELSAAGVRADSLELKADSGSPLGTLVSVWDVLTRNGFPIRDVPARIRKSATGEGR